MLKSADVYSFGEFVLDAGDRRLTRNGAPVEISGRYFDALVLLVREAGRLVSKDRFMGEVWRGIPVTDEALTQCIRSLRRQLGDDAASPRLIETVPKHGYRFIAPLRGANHSSRTAQSPDVPPLDRVMRLAGAGLTGGATAGFVGGLIYGFAGTAQPGPGSLSILLVVLSLCVVVAVIGAVGVSIGLAAALVRRPASTAWLIAGAALGGMIIGALVQLLGLDAFSLLIGRAPVGITGAPEGACIGAATGLGATFAFASGDRPRLRKGASLSALAGGLAGAVIPLLGGRLMLGSLGLVAETFPDSRLRLDHLGAYAGEQGIGPITQSVSGALEGALFAACVVGAMVIARRGLAAPSGRSAEAGEGQH